MLETLGIVKKRCQFIKGAARGTFKCSIHKDKKII
jgi:hypothetical protein